MDSLTGVASGDVRSEVHAGQPFRTRRTTGFDPKQSLALPKEIEHWFLTTLREMLIKIGAKVVCHGRYITFQLAEVAIPRSLFG